MPTPPPLPRKEGSTPAGPTPPPLNKEQSTLTPPPLPVRNAPMPGHQAPSGPQGPQGPGGPQEPGDETPKPSKAGLYVVALLLAGIIVIIAVVVLVLCDTFSKSTDFKSDTFDDSCAVDTVADVYNDLNFEEVSHFTPGDFYGKGTISDFPFSIDIKIGSNGQVTGSYWNMLYDIPLKVTGYEDSNQALHLQLGTGSGASSLFLEPAGEGMYTGTWGAKKHAVSVELLSSPHSDSKPTIHSDDIELTVDFGGGISKTAYVRGLSSGSSSIKFYYPDQPAGNMFNVKKRSPDLVILSPVDGFEVARINTNGYSPYTMTTYNGKEFEVYKAD